MPSRPKGEQTGQLRLGYRMASSGLRFPSEGLREMTCAQIILRARRAATALAVPRGVRGADKTLFQQWADDAMYELEQRGYSRGHAKALIDSRPTPHGPRAQVHFETGAKGPAIDFRGKAGARTATEDRR